MEAIVSQDYRIWTEKVIFLQLQEYEKGCP